MILGVILRRWRATTDLSIRDVSKTIGISAATLSRIERGESMDGKTLAAVIRWITSEGSDL